MSATSVRPSKEVGYLSGGIKLILMVVTVVVSWGVVPAFAQLGGLAGDVTTFWVNITALPAVALFSYAFARHKFRDFTLKQYTLMALVGVVWPLLYSVAYFNAAVQLGAAMTSLLNYTWPLWYFVFGMWLVPEKMARYNKKLMLLSIAILLVGVGVVQFYSTDARVVLGPMLLAGLFAGMSQGFYTVANDRWDFDPWVMTLVIEAVTVLGVTPWVLLNHGEIPIPNTTTLMYLTIIGVISNGIGFWAFLASSKLSDDLAKNTTWVKPMWLVAVSTVPFAQILVAMLMGLPVPIQYWYGAVFVVLALLAAKFAQRKK